MRTLASVGLAEAMKLAYPRRNVDAVLLSGLWGSTSYLSRGRAPETLDERMEDRRMHLWLGMCTLKSCPCPHQEPWG